MENKKIIIAGLVLTFILTGIFSEPLQNIIDKISLNNSKVASEVSVGDLIINLYDTNGGLIKSIKNPLTLYLKAPDKIKVTISAGGKETVMSQIGKVIYQKNSPDGAVTSKKAEDKEDLFKKYLGYGIEKLLSVFIATNIENLPNEIISYTLEPIDRQLPVEKYILQIDQKTGMNVYEAVYSKGVKTYDVSKEYSLIDNLYILKKMKLTIVQDGMKIETIFDYASVSLNTKILDKEFDLK